MNYINGNLSSRLHDFGFRGCTSVEQAVIGGAAHLVSKFI
jgi:nicotinamide phosphoribosyltransferase